MRTLFVFDQDTEFIELLVFVTRSQMNEELQLLTCSDEFKLAQVIDGKKINAALVHCKINGSGRSVTKELQIRKIPFGLITSRIDPPMQRIADELGRPLLTKDNFMKLPLLETIINLMPSEEGGGSPEIV